MSLYPCLSILFALLLWAVVHTGNARPDPKAPPTETQREPSSTGLETPS